MDYCKLVKLIMLATLIAVLVMLISSVNKRKIYEKDGVKYVDDVKDLLMKFLNMFGIRCANSTENFQIYEEINQEEINQEDNNEQKDEADEVDGSEEEQEENNAQPSGITCSASICGGGNNMEDNAVKKYLDEYVYNGNLTCELSNKVPKDEFRKNYFYFGDRININSNITGDGDVVDKLNEMYLSENTEVAEGFNGYAGYEGKKIKDIFNDLTQHYDPGCIKEPIVDKTTMSSFYVKEGMGGDYVDNTLRIYENDGVETGGVFMPEGNVYGNDGQGEFPMFIH